MRETFIRSVLRALKNFQEAQVIIKLHPGENDEAYKKVVEEENVRVKMLSKSSDTIEALYACDLLVAAFSTVITEALVLGKPAVTLNLTAEDPVPYYKEVTLRVDKEEDLAPAIRKALYDEKTREKLKKERKKFISKHVYKQDGKATERLIGLIERMIKKRR
jgi:surface carbohydrate biosynthesis protein